MRKVRGIPLPYILTFLLLSLFLCGCVAEQNNTVVMHLPEESSYSQALKENLGDYALERMRDGIFWHLERGAVVEATEPQAYFAQKNGVAEYWYPHYQSTAVIAIDRDRTTAKIDDWTDIVGLEEKVAFFQGSMGIGANALLAAISYGLEGEQYNFDSAARLLEELNASARLVFNSFDAPILICFDEQAARLIREGRNIEVIVPESGTFSYVKGLLTNTPLTFDGDVETALCNAGLRLLDGRCDETLYPDADSYASASSIPDFERFLTLSQNTERLMRRRVQHIRLYTTADGREHQLSALIYIAILVFWTATVVRRAMQKSVRRSVFAICAIMLCWITVRLVKYQVGSLVFWDRFLWFSFLAFQIMLTFTLLWMACMVNKAETRRTPKWLRIVAGLDVMLILFVFTNDIHGCVYIIDFASPFWRDNYGYGVGFYITAACFAAQFAAANVILLIKSIRGPGKGGTVFPLALCAFITVYHLGYVTGNQIMRESDMTMVTGIFALLFFESAIRCGMIPTNTKYTQVFSHSPLNMQILDSEGKAALRSAAATPLDERAIAHVLSKSEKPILQDENTLLYASAIAGGFVVWRDDIESLNQLHREIEESVKKLRAATALFAEEGERRAMHEESAKLRLMGQLEAEIEEKTVRLTRMIDAFPEVEDMPLETARIALLLCYIKRRCNLFFRERETANLPADELTVYIDELSELAVSAGVKIASGSLLLGELPVRRATLLYDFFYEVVALASGCKCSTMLFSLGMQDNNVVMRLLPSEDIQLGLLDERFLTIIAEEGGNIAIKDLDDAVGISLSFPNGGDGCA